MQLWNVTIGILMVQREYMNVRISVLGQTSGGVLQ